MRKRVLTTWLTMLLAAAFLAGCAASSGQQTGQNDASTESASAAVGLAPGDSVSISGENHNITLHSLDFLDENTGFLLQDRYDAGGQVHSQLLATQDGGVHWDKIGTDDTMLLRTVRFADREAGWAVTQTEIPGAGSGNVRYAIVHTEDGGQSWTAQWQSGSATVSDPGLWFSDSKSGYALVGGSLLATRDGGAHWSAFSLGRDFTPQRMFFLDSSTGWVTGIGGKNGAEVSVLQTKDGGAHWNVQFRKEYSGSGPVGTIDIGFVDQNTGWFLTSDLGTWEGELYSTENGGNHWEKINEIRCIRPTPTSLQFVSAQVGWISLDPGAGPIAGGLMVTRDGGRSFQVLGGSGMDTSEDTQKITDAQEVEFLPGRQELGWFIGRDVSHGDFLMRTEDGGTTWKQVCPGIAPTEDISFPDAQTGFGIGALSDPGAVLCTTDGGGSWRTLASFTGTYWPKKISFISPQTGWMVAQPEGADTDTSASVILQTQDGGGTWTKRGSLPTDAEIAYFKFFDAHSGIIVTSDSRGAYYRTSDGGETWTAIPRSGEDSALDQFAFISANQGWKLRNPGTSKTPYAVLMSHTSDGKTWEEDGTVASGAAAYAFVFLSDQKAIMLAEAPPYQQDSRMELLTTKDGGKSWEMHPLPEGINGNTFGMTGSQLSMRFSDDAHGWLLTAFGLLATQDGGRTWTWE